MVAHPNHAAIVRQFFGTVGSNKPRTSSGAASRAPSRACGQKLETIGGGKKDGQARAIVAATRAPVRRARPCSAFSSMTAPSPSAPSSASASARVGTRSPAKAGPNQLPASWQRMAASGRAATLPCPSVVRPSQASCSRIGSSSAVRRTSHSTHRQPRQAARRSAASVFSGALAAAPRCPMTGGSGTREGDIAPHGRPARLGNGLGRLRALGGPPRTQILAGLLIDLAHAELDLAALVETEHLDLHHVALFDHVGNPGDALRRELADMHEPVARTEKVHERAEIDDLNHLAGIDLPDFRLGDDAADPVDRGLRGAGVDGGDFDRAVILDVDLGAGRLGDFADDLAARADPLADLVPRY